MAAKPIWPQPRQGPICYTVLILDFPRAYNVYPYNREKLPLDEVNEHFTRYAGVMFYRLAVANKNM